MFNQLVTKALGRMSLAYSPGSARAPDASGGKASETPGDRVYPDLDMTFITGNLVAMGMVTKTGVNSPKKGTPSSSSTPSQPKEYVKTPGQNDCERLGQYVSEHHRDHFLAVNISDDPCDPMTYHCLHHQIAEFHWQSLGSKSQTPTIPHAFQICYAIKSFTSINPNNVAAVFCQNGKTRTGIIISCYLRFAGLTDSAFDGFNRFCSLRCRSIAQDSINSSIPPSLTQFFRNFDDCIELGGFPNPEPLILKAVRVCGVPVDDIPIIDVWDENSQIYCSYTDTTVDGQQWDQENEEGFFKVQKRVLGSFVVLCRFGGPYAKDKDDASKVLFRYGHSSGFCCPGAYEMKKSKVDMMKRYADSIEEEDFQLTLLFAGDDGRTSLPEGAVTSLPRILDGEEAFDEGWLSLSKVHACAPSAEALAVLIAEGFPLEAATVALQLTNNCIQSAIMSLSEGSLLELCQRHGFHPQDVKSSAAAASRRVLDEDDDDYDDLVRERSRTIEEPPSYQGGNAGDPPSRRGSEIGGAAAGSLVQAAIAVSITPRETKVDENIDDAKQQKLRESERFVLKLSDLEQNLGDLDGFVINKGGRSSTSEKKSLFEDFRDEVGSIPPSIVPNEKQGDEGSGGLDAAGSKRAASVRIPSSRGGERTPPRRHTSAHPLQLDEVSKRLDGVAGMQQDDNCADDDDDSNFVDAVSETASTTKTKREGRNKNTFVGGSKNLFDDDDDVGSSPSVVRVLNAGAAPEKKQQAPPDDPTAALLRQLALAGLSVDDLIKLKQGNMNWSDVERRSDAAAPSAAATTNHADKSKVASAQTKLTSSSESGTSSPKPSSPPSTPLSAADAMKAMFAKRAAAGATPPAAPPAAAGPPSPTNAAPILSPADAMKAMLAKRNGPPGGASAPPPVPDSPAIVTVSGLPALKDDPAYSKYFKMLKTGLPKDVVKHAMERDSVDPEILDLDPTVPLAPKPLLKDDPAYSKFFKMLKMFIPREAVKHAMVKEGLDPEFLDADPDKPTPKISPKKKPLPLAKRAARPMLKDDPKYSSYFTLLSEGKTTDEVKAAMVEAGLDPSILDLDRNKPLPKDHVESEPSPAAVKAVRRKKLHWNPIDKTKIDSDSIWGQVQTGVGGGIDFDGIEMDLAEFDTLFVAKNSPEQKDKKSSAAADKKGAAGGSDKKKKKAAVQVIDGKRGMNGGIALARVKIPFGVVAESIDAMKENVLTLEQLQALKEFIPTAEEIAKLNDWVTKYKQKHPKEDPLEELCECEKFMVAMFEVRDSIKKIDSLVYKSLFSARRNDLLLELTRIETACDDVKISLRLKKLLAIILKVGNQLNSADGDGGVAHAFTLESLLKLNEAKAFDKKTSILHYLVMLVMRNDQTLLNFKEDIVSVADAERIVLSAICDELRKLESGLNVLKQVAVDEAQRLKAKGSFSRKMTVAEIASQKTLVRTSDNGKVHFDAAYPVDDLALTPAGRFSIDASKLLAEATSTAERVKSKFASVLKYFGESETMQTHQFFSTLSKFIRSFDEAHNEVVKKEKAKARLARLESMKKAQEDKEAEAKEKDLNAASGARDRKSSSEKKDEQHKKKLEAAGPRLDGDEEDDMLESAAISDGVPILSLRTSPVPLDSIRSGVQATPSSSKKSARRASVL